MFAAINLQELPQQRTDEELVVLAQNGDSESMEYILQKYRLWAYSLAKPYFMPGYDKDDVFQEGLIGLYKAVRDYQPGKNPFWTFARLCITRNVYTAVVKANRGKHTFLSEAASLDKPLIEGNPDFSLHEMIPATDNPEKHVIALESKERLIKIMKETLTDLERDVLKHHLNGRKYSEIACLIGRNEKAVDNALQRARKKIKEAVSSWLN